MVSLIAFQVELLPHSLEIHSEAVTAPCVKSAHISLKKKGKKKKENVLVKTL